MVQAGGRGVWVRRVGGRLVRVGLKSFGGGVSHGLGLSDWWCGGGGGQGEGGKFAAVGDQAGGGGVGLQVREVVFAQVGCGVAGQQAGVFGAGGEEHFRAGVGADGELHFLGHLGHVLVGQHHRQAVSAGFGQDLVERAGQRQEVLAFVDVHCAVGAA